MKLYFLCTKWVVFGDLIGIGKQKPLAMCDLAVGKVTYGASGYLVTYAPYFVS